MPRRVAITGASGQLGREVVRAFTEAGDDVLALARPEFDITDQASLGRLTAWRPDVVVNSAAWTDVDGCARDPERAMRINGEAAGAVARSATDAGALIVQISTNEVFDGSLDRPYTEEDEPNPINPYGASKLAGERLVVEANPHHLLIRTAWLFGPGGTNFVAKIVAAAERARRSGEGLRVVHDEMGNPTWVPQLADAVASSLSSEQRILHAAGTPPASRLEWARVALEAAGIDVPVDPVPLASFPRASRPPLRAVLRLSPTLPPIQWRAPTERFAAGLARARVER